MGNESRGFLYVVLVVLCVGVSVYTTYEGFLTFFGFLSPAIAGVIGVGLLAVDFAVRENRRLGKSIIPPVIFLVFCMAASAPSHFNFFYSRSIGPTLIADKVEQSIETYDKNLGSANALLDQLDSQAVARGEIARELNLLKEQIDDTGRAGYGGRADRHVSAIVDAAARANSPFTEFYRPSIGTPAIDARAWLRRDFEPMVTKRLATLSAESKAGALRAELAGDSDNVLVQRANFERSGSRDAQIEDGKKLIEFVKTTTYSMETRVDQLSKAIGGEGWRLEKPPVNPVDAQVGNVALSYRSGIVEREYPQYTLFAIVASLIVDLLPLMFVLLLSSAAQESVGEKQKKRFGSRKSLAGVELLGPKTKRRAS